MFKNSKFKSLILFFGRVKVVNIYFGKNKVFLRKIEIISMSGQSYQYFWLYRKG